MSSKGKITIIIIRLEHNWETDLNHMNIIKPIKSGMSKIFLYTVSTKNKPTDIGSEISVWETHLVAAGVALRW